MPIVLVAAVAKNGVIGAAGSLPWHLPEDLEHFKQITTGHPIIMGRKTFESIARPLPGRRNIVITRDPMFRSVGVETSRSLEAALASAGANNPEQTVMVIGGGEVYAQSIDRADRLEITHVNREVDGDTHFPAIDAKVWERISYLPKDSCAFATYTRRAPGTRQLRTLLAGLEPALDPVEYGYITVPTGQLPAEIVPKVTITESGSLAVIAPWAQAVAAGYEPSNRCRCVVVQIPAALDAVGLLASLGQALAKKDISCNAAAGFEHAYLFVAPDRADEAIAAIAALAR